MKDYQLIELMENSLFNDSLPNKLLQEVFDYQIKESQAITEKLYYNIVENTPHVLDINKIPEEKLRLVVDASDDFLEQYKDGMIKLSKEKGHLVAQIKENGKYGSKLPIKEETYSEGINYLDMQNAIQLQVIQDSLVTISEQIHVIDDNVKNILTGQMNDRLGLYYSGIALYIESCNVQESELKKQLVAQSIKSLSDAIFQMTLMIQTDIDYLARKEYDINKKNKFNLINDKITNIERAFVTIHQASIMKTAIYCYQGEINAMVAVLQQYKKFIEGTIVANAEMLSLCDSSKERMIQRTWKKRSEFQLDVDNLVAQLRVKEQYIIMDNGGVMDYECN